VNLEFWRGASSTYQPPWSIFFICLLYCSWVNHVTLTFITWFRLRIPDHDRRWHVAFYKQREEGRQRSLLESKSHPLLLTPTALHNPGHGFQSPCMLILLCLRKQSFDLIIILRACALCLLTKFISAHSCASKARRTMPNAWSLFVKSEKLHKPRGRLRLKVFTPNFLL